MKPKLILFDAANTLIHKPDLWPRFNDVLVSSGFEVDITDLQKMHKLVSELIHFPDRTSETFYKQFNSEVLLGLGIIPTEQLLNDIFKACTYLPWQPFEDTQILNEIDCPKAILSNFNSSLKEKIGSLFEKNTFEAIICSEEEKIQKPDIKFYERAIKILGIEPSEILYIGDSIKLDIIPALNVGMNVRLIDRHNIFGYFNKRINSLNDLNAIVR